MFSFACRTGCTSVLLSGGRNKKWGPHVTKATPAARWWQWILQLCYRWPCFFPWASERHLMSLGAAQMPFSQHTVGLKADVPVWVCPVHRIWHDGDTKLSVVGTHLSSASCTAHLFSCTYYSCSAFMEMIFLTSWGNTVLLVHFMAEELRELERFCQRSCQKTSDRAGDELESIVSF